MREMKIEIEFVMIEMEESGRHCERGRGGRLPFLSCCRFIAA